MTKAVFPRAGFIIGLIALAALLAGAVFSRVYDRYLTTSSPGLTRSGYVVATIDTTGLPTGSNSVSVSARTRSGGAVSASVAFSVVASSGSGGSTPAPTPTSTTTASPTAAPVAFPAGYFCCANYYPPSTDLREQRMRRGKRDIIRVAGGQRIVSRTSPPTGRGLTAHPSYQCIVGPLDPGWRYISRTFSLIADEWLPWTPAGPITVPPGGTEGEPATDRQIPGKPEWLCDESNAYQEGEIKIEFPGNDRRAMDKAGRECTDQCRGLFASFNCIGYPGRSHGYITWPSKPIKARIACRQWEETKEWSKRVCEEGGGTISTPPCKDEDGNAVACVFRGSGWKYPCLDENRNRDYVTEGQYVCPEEIRNPARTYEKYKVNYSTCHSTPLSACDIDAISVDNPSDAICRSV